MLFYASFPNRWTNYFHSDATVHIDRMNILHPWISWSSSALLLKWADWYLQMWNDKHKFTGRFRERSHFRAQGESTIFGWPAHVLANHKNSSALPILLYYSPFLLCSLQLCVSMQLFDEHLLMLPLWAPRHLSYPPLISQCLAKSSDSINVNLNVWRNQWMKWHLDTHKAPKFEEFCVSFNTNLVYLSLRVNACICVAICLHIYIWSGRADFLRGKQMFILS